MKINLELDENLFLPKFLPYLFDYSHRFEVYRGSAGSGKSYFITQKLLIRAFNEKIKILVCRRYGTTIRNSVFALFKDILSSWQLLPYVKIRESDFNITLPNGSEIIFIGLDDENKLLSITNIGSIFVEEVTECSRDILEQLNIRMRGKNKQQQILMALNPVSKNNFMYEWLEVNPPSDLLYLQSTYKDNPHLPKEYVAALEELIVRNPRRAQVYVYNQWGADTAGLVLTNWEIKTFDPLEIVKQPKVEHRCGLDFGYIDASAIVEVLYDPINHIIYVINEFYKTGQTLDQLANVIDAMGLHKSKIYADAAEPRSIDFFRAKGMNVYPSIKGQGSVESGIAFLQNNKIIVLPKCECVITELENFSYIQDKKTGEYTSKTTHEFSHSIDAMRYAVCDIYTNKQLKSFDKKLLSIR